MKRYYVEYKQGYEGENEVTSYLYVMAYNQQQIRDMFVEYELVTIDITE